jgi:hypothetical protein
MVPGLNFPHRECAHFYSTARMSSTKNARPAVRAKTGKRGQTRPGGHNFINCFPFTCKNSFLTATRCAALTPQDEKFLPRLPDLIKALDFHSKIGDTNLYLSGVARFFPSPSGGATAPPSGAKGRRSGISPENSAHSTAARGFPGMPTLQNGVFNEKNSCCH